MRNFFPITALVASALLAGCSEEAPKPSAEEVLIEKAQGIHDRVLTLDTHVDVGNSVYTDPAGSIGELTDHQVDLVKMEEGGLDAGFFIVFTGQGPRDVVGYRKAEDTALSLLWAIYRNVNANSDRIGLATTAAEVRAIAASGRKVALIGMENGYPLVTDIDTLGKYYELGVRYLGLIHGGHNALGDSANPVPPLGDTEAEHGGLSDAGRAMIAQANRLGIMVDVSHAAESTTLQATELSRAPVIASHSSTEALVPVARNASDAELKAVAATGGVIQVVALSSYVIPDAEGMLQERAALDEEFGLANSWAARSLPEDKVGEYYRRRAAISDKWPQATVSQFVDHIDHVRNLVGIDHVGISSDFGGGGGIDGWADGSETFNVTLELVRRGYSEEEIAKIWGGNLLRVMEDVEKVAAELKAQ